LDRHLKTHAADAAGMVGDVLVGGHSGSCSVSVSVCGDELVGHPEDEDDDDEDDDVTDMDDDDDLTSDLTTVVTVVTTDD
jgi:hypothetical protein